MSQVKVPVGLADQAFMSLVEALGLMETSSWAVLLCKFADDASAPPDREHYERLFTGSGRGSSNVVDFFSDMSHGKLDLGGSEVFGWYTLQKNRADYVGNVPMAPPGKLNRNGLFDLCRRTAADAGVDFSQFAGVVVSMNQSVDLFGYVGGMAAMCDTLSLKPSLLGQEMGHGYGLDHARRDGSTDDYADPWDIMSTAAAFMADNAEYEQIGPGLNAASMRSRGWLDEGRVWRPSNSAYDSTVQLRPLHRRDLSGLLAAELGQFLVEFRQKERWDAAIPRSCVLVHRFEDNHSYIMPGTSGSLDLGAGDTFLAGLRGLSPYSELEVKDIDEAAQVATIRLVYQPAPRPPGDIFGQIFGGVAVDGGGFVVVGGKVVPVPPRGPTIAMLDQLVAYLEVEALNDASARSAARQAAVSGLARRALTELRELDSRRLPTAERPDARRLERRE